MNCSSLFIPFTFDSERVSGTGPTTLFTANRLARLNKACTSTRTVVFLTYAALQVLGDVGVVVFGGQRGSCLPLGAAARARDAGVYIRRVAEQQLHAGQVAIHRSRH